MYVDINTILYVQREETRNKGRKERQNDRDRRGGGERKADNEGT